MLTYFIKIIFKRSYKYLFLTFFSIVVGAFLFGASVSLSRSISNYFIIEGKTLIGGDIVISGATELRLNSPEFLDDTKLQNIINKNLIISQESSLQGVFKNKNSSSTSPASIRIVQNSFPLYGEVLTDPAPFNLFDVAASSYNFSTTSYLKNNVNNNINYIYAEQNFLDRMDAKVGDDIILGNANFKIKGVLLKEPDSISFGVSFTPKVIISERDFAKSGIDFNQSRINYKTLIKQDTNNPLTKEDKTYLESFVKDKKLRYDDSTNGPNNFVRGLSSIESFVGIVIAIALFLVVVNIIANLTYIISKFKKTIAIMKTFGMPSRSIQIIYGFIFGSIGLIAGAIGSMSGAYASNYSLDYIKAYTDANIQSIAVLPVIIIGGLVGLMIILAAAFPFFNSVKNISPRELLLSAKINEMGDSKDQNKNQNKYRKLYKLLHLLLLYLPIPIILTASLYILSSNIKLVLYSIVGLIICFALFMLISYFIINILYKNRKHFPFIIQSSLASLKWRGLESLIIAASIMTAYSGVFIVSAIEKNIVTNIQQNVSAKAPSLYLVDISKSQIQDVKKIVGETFVEYPIIRGRLLEISGKDITLSGDPGLTREFNMTYRSGLINEEKVIAGSWHGENIINSVSIEESFAKEIGGVKLGDKVKVFIQGLTVEATITSIRTTDRSSGTPFFFLVFSPDLLSKFPSSYFATANLSKENIKKVEQELGSKYSNVIPIQTGKILDTVSNIVDNIVLALKVLGLPSIILGLMLVLVMTSQSLYERRGDILVLRAFGLRSKNIKYLFILEMAGLIMVASIIAYIVANSLAYALNYFLFNFETFVFSYTPLIISSITVIIVSAFALILSRTITSSSLRELLSEK